MTDKDCVRSFQDVGPVLRSTPEILVGVDDDAASGHVLLWAARQSQPQGSATLLPVHMLAT